MPYAKDILMGNSEKLIYVYRFYRKPNFNCTWVPNWGNSTLMNKVYSTESRKYTLLNKVYSINNRKQLLMAFEQEQHLKINTYVGGRREPGDKRT